MDEGLIGPLAAQLHPHHYPHHHASSSSSASPPGALAGVFGSLDDFSESAFINGRGGAGRALPHDAASGLGAVVIKPSVLGGLEAAWHAAELAARGGAAAVISSAFESSVGVSALAQLAAAAVVALGARAPAGTGAARPGAEGEGEGGGAWAGGYHGLGTLEWFESDVVAPGLKGCPGSPADGACARGAAAAADQRRQQHAGQQALLIERAREITEGAAAAALGAAAGLGSKPPTGDYSILDAIPPSSCLLDASSDDPLVEQRFYELQLPAALGGACRARCLLARPRPASGAPEGSSGGSNSSSSGDTATAPSSSVAEVGGGGGRAPLVFLHGFMGDASDWAPVMRALAAAGHPCLSVDLPGHGGTRAVLASGGSSDDSGSGSGNGGGCSSSGGSGGGLYSLDAAAALVSKAASAAFGREARCVLVGYSMGARVALHLIANSNSSSSGMGQKRQNQRQPQQQRLQLRHQQQWRAAVVISGTPGIPNEEQRSDRAARDVELSEVLRRQGLTSFVDWWYRQPLWTSLKGHPRFGEMAAKRAAAGDAEELAAALAGMSTGRMVGGAGGGGRGLQQGQVCGSTVISKRP